MRAELRRRPLWSGLAVAMVGVALWSGAAAGQTLDFWVMPFVDQPQVALAPFLQKFEQVSGIRVNVTVIPYGEALERLQTAIVARRAPDITYMTDGRFVPLVEFGGALAQLDRFMPADFEARYVDPKILTQYRWQGRYYVVPFGFVTYLWAINTDSFRAAGISPSLVQRMKDPSGVWTWGDLESVLQALTRDTDGDGRVDRWGYAYPGSNTWLHPFLLWLWNAGGEIFDAQNRVALQPEAVERALGFLVKIKSAGYMPPGAESMTAPDAIDAFATGRTGIINNVWPANGLFVWPRQYPNLRYELVYPPVGPTGRRTTYFGGALLAILEQSQKKEAAWKLIEFFLTDEVQEWLSGVGFFPVTGKLPAAMRERPEVKMYYDAVNWAIPEPRHPKTGVVMSVVNREVSAVMAGRKTPAQAARDMKAAAEREAGF